MYSELSREDVYRLIFCCCTFLNWGHRHCHAQNTKKCRCNVFKPLAVLFYFSNSSRLGDCIKISVQLANWSNCSLTGSPQRAGRWFDGSDLGWDMMGHIGPAPFLAQNNRTQINDIKHDSKLVEYYLAAIVQIYTILQHGGLSSWRVKDQFQFLNRNHHHHIRLFPSGRTVLAKWTT